MPYWFPSLRFHRPAREAVCSQIDLAPQELGSLRGQKEGLGSEQETEQRQQETEQGQAGNALVEFVALAGLLMVPTIYFLLSVFALQNAAFAASSAGAQTLQVLAQLPEEQRSQELASSLAILAASDYGIEDQQVQTQLICPTSCAQGENLVLLVTVSVELPLVPWPGAPTFAQMTSRSVSWAGAYS